MAQQRLELISPLQISLIAIRYIGVGEKIEDLREFNAEEFIEALFVHENEE